MQINKVILLGNVGKDPEVRYLESGTAVAKFPLATTETYKNRNGERVSVTEWHNIVLWRDLAETAEKLIRKGSQIFIEGRLRTRSWEDKEGNKRYITEVVVSNLVLGRRKPTTTNQNGDEHKAELDEIHSLTEKGAEPVHIEVEADDLPF